MLRPELKNLATILFHILRKSPTMDGIYRYRHNYVTAATNAVTVCIPISILLFAQ